VALLPKTAPILAVGGDLKNALTLVVDGQAFAGQHVGDLDHLSAREAFVAAARDLCATYQLAGEDVTVAHDLHPGYVSTQFALSFGARHIGVQHHRAHVASVLAERGAFDEPVLAFSFDGTGYGDDGTIWGGEVFAGSMATGLERVGHLRQSWLPGGDAAARFPVQAAAGFLYDVDDGEAFLEAPFAFPQRYSQARSLVAHGVRCFATTSMGRLFDTVAALCGFIREQTFEGQAAMWLEQLARDAGGDVPPYTIAFRDGELDARPMLRAIVEDRVAGRSCEEVAAAFHAAIVRAIVALAAETADRRVVVSGGVFQNAVLIESLVSALGERLWFNTIVPPNDGGLSLGQAAFAAL
jgi:hydrogenase maturation protein HypF